MYCQFRFQQNLQTNCSQQLKQIQKQQITVDLPNQTVTLVATGESESFVINGYKKGNMLNGFDDIDYLKNIEGEITAFAETRPF